MPLYEVDFSYKLPEFGLVTLEAKDLDDAERLGLEYVRDTYEDITDIEIEGIKEIVAPSVELNQ